MPLPSRQALEAELRRIGDPHLLRQAGELWSGLAAALWIGGPDNVRDDVWPALQAAPTGSGIAGVEAALRQQVERRRQGDGSEAGEDGQRRVAGA